MAETRRRRFSLEQIAQMLDLLADRIGSLVSINVEKTIRNSELAKKLGIEPFCETKTENTAQNPVDLEPQQRTREVNKPCSVEGCQEPARARGLCSRHYQKQRYAERCATKTKRGSGICSVENCGGNVYANDMCSRHFMEWVRSRRK